MDSSLLSSYFPYSSFPNISGTNFEEPYYAGYDVHSQPANSEVLITHMAKRRFEDTSKDTEHSRSPLKKMKEENLLDSQVEKILLLKKEVGRNSDWTEEQYKHLNRLESEYPRQWKKIAQIMAGDFPGFIKTPHQCSYHWKKLHKSAAVDSQLKKREWTDEEITLFMEHLQEFGNDAKLYMPLFPDRTKKEIKKYLKQIKMNSPLQGPQEEDIFYQDPPPKEVEIIKGSVDPIFDEDNSVGYYLPPVPSCRQEECPAAIQDVRFDVLPVAGDLESLPAISSNISIFEELEMDSLF